jgi:transposase-like protein
MRRAKGEEHHNARLKAVDIPLLKLKHTQGATFTELAAEYGVHPSTVQKAVRGQNWRSLDDTTPVPEGRRRWTKEERAYLQAHAKDDAATVARHLQRSVMAIYIARAQIRKRQPQWETTAS